jgi:hypothetical protein
VLLFFVYTLRVPLFRPLAPFFIDRKGHRGDRNTMSSCGDLWPSVSKTRRLIDFLLQSAVYQIQHKRNMAVLTGVRSPRWFEKKY